MSKNKVKIINIFGGPSVGKSVLRAELFVKMKKNNYKVEEITEYAKDLTYGEDNVKLSNQLHILGEQYHRQFVLMDKVDYILTDSPFCLGIAYLNGDKYLPKEKYTDFVISLYESFENINIFINRNNSYKYQEFGRSQSLEEAITKDNEIKKLLNKYNVKYIDVEMGDNLVDKVFSLISKKRNI